MLKTPSRKFEFTSTLLKEIDGRSSAQTEAGAPRYVAPLFRGDENDYPFVLTTYQPVLMMESGNQNYPWAQEIFFVMHGVGWKMG